MPFTYAGQYGPEIFEDDVRQLIRNGSVRVELPGTNTLATLYTNRTKGAGGANPFLTDARGNGSFFAEPGQYELVYAGATLNVTVHADPAEVSSGTGGIPDDGSVTNIKVAATAAIVESKLALASDAAAATASRRTLGTGALQATAGNDTRLSNERNPVNGSVTIAKVSTTNVGVALDVLRKNSANTAMEWVAPGTGTGGTPSAHASTHASAGTDPVALAASQITSGQLAMARLASGVADGTKFVRDDGTLAVPASGTGTTPADGSVTIPKIATANVGAALDVLRKNAANTAMEWSAPAAGSGGSAAATTYSPNGTIISTDVQAAITEVAGDASTALGAHESDTLGVHGITDTAALLLKSGGTMTGLLTLSGPPTSTLHAATKAYVDAGGGTGISPTIVDAAGDLIVATGSDAVARLPRGAALNVLQTNAAGTNIEWAAPSGGGGGIPATIMDAPGDLIVASAADTAVRLARGAALQVLRTNAAGTNLEWAAPAAGGTSNVVTARRATDGAAIASSIVVVDDAVLTLAVAANTAYILEGFIRYDSVGAADIRLRLNAPAGVTGSWATTDDGLAHPEYLYGSENIIQTGITGAILVRGILMVGATAGSLVLGHAQGASSVSGTKIVAGSFLRLEPIA